MIIGSILYDWAKDAYLGCPFVHAGRSRFTGVDCIGLIIEPARDLLLIDFSPPNYSSAFKMEEIIEAVSRLGKQVELGEEKAGDVLLFSIRGRPRHLAYTDGKGNMLHSDMKAGCVVEHEILEKYQRQLVSVWRWNKLWQQ